MRGIRVRSSRRRPGAGRRPALLGIVALALGSLVLGSLPATTTDAAWTATALGTGSTPSVGAWCATPGSTVPDSNRFIRLSTLTTSTPISGVTHHLAIIPVANNTAWGAGVAGVNRTLGVRLWSCQEAPVGNLRVTAWSNPSGTIPPRTWLAGTDAALTPASRLNPATAGGLGAQLATLATNPSVSATLPALLGAAGSGDARRYSWLVSSTRTAAAPAAVPPQTLTALLGSKPGCDRTLSLGVATCALDLRTGTDAAAGSSAPFSSVFSTTPYALAAGPTGVAYTATTYATQAATGWGAVNANIAETCVVGPLSTGCTPSATNVSLNPTGTDAQRLSSTDGNRMQWVVIDWVGSVQPTSDVAVEIVLQ